MSRDTTEFQFELNETLYFEDGYEVQEFIGMALEPEITIHSYDTYVSIRGEIELRGEYLREVKEIGEEPSVELEDFQTKRFIEKVVAKENHIAEFSHRFPVDISVPAYRINNLDDITVDILTFDYELPVNSKLQLTAIAAIHGMKAEIDLLQEKQKRETSEKESENQDSTYFEFEIKPREKEKEDVRLKEKTVEEPITSEVTEDKQLKSNPDSIETYIQELQDEVVERENENLVMNRSQTAKEEREREVKQDGDKQEEEAVNDVNYLTDMFRDADEERYSKMRICIVQEDDTIETIAEKFQVSALQLIKQNKLDEDYKIDEGQLLYIPRK